MAKGIFSAQENRTIDGLMRKSIKADTRPVVGFFFLDGYEGAIVAKNGITHRFLGKRPRTMEDLHKKVEEGRYENGKFKALRILNGDETDWGGPRIGAVTAVLHITLITR